MKLEHCRERIIKILYCVYILEILVYEKNGGEGKEFDNIIPHYSKTG